MTIDLSIVVPTYNENEDIINFIKSYLVFSNSKTELIIVDDSTDNTFNMILDFIQKQEPCNIFAFKNPLDKGRCEARNYGIIKSKGEYVALCNADNILPNNYLVNFYKKKKLNYDTISFRSHLVIKNKTTDLYLSFNENYKFFSDFFLYKEIIKKNSLVWTEGFIIKKDIIVKSGGFPMVKNDSLHAGDDNSMILNIQKTGIEIKSIFCSNISIKHVMPDEFEAYRSNRIGRGLGVPQIKYYIYKKSIKSIFLYLLLKHLYKIFFYILMPIHTIKNFLIMKPYSVNFSYSFQKFYYYFIQENLLTMYGEWIQLYKITKNKLQNKKVLISYLGSINKDYD